MPPAKASVVVGIDIGGTFTDLVLVDRIRSVTGIGKTLTTPSEPWRGVAAGLSELLKNNGYQFEEIDQIIHGTTLVTNALIERKGAKTALITTKGFRDVLEIRRESRYDMYDISIQFPEPLVPRRHRYEVEERVLADGQVLREFKEDEARNLIRRIAEQGIKSAGVSLIHSYRNPVHERRIGELFSQIAPRIRVSLSSDICPEIREFERTSTVVANAYIQPVVENYLERLQDCLREMGFTGDLFIMISNGGICTVQTAIKYPIRLLESGPAAGVLGAAFFGDLIKADKLLSFDMGGTTAKACIINSGQPTVSNEFEVGRVHRFSKGSGFPVRVPVIEMIEIGAGGGSIARLNSLGLLKVGPDSASSDPGPVCYALGGTEPTVTDADLVLGYLNQDYFLGGKMRLDLQAAERAIEEKIAKPLGVTVAEAAWGIHETVNENMAAAARIHAIERGKEAQSYPLFAFGGAGPVHAFRVAKILKVEKLIIPKGAGVGSALGFLVAPLAFDFVRSYRGILGNLDWEHLAGLYREMEGDGTRTLIDSGLSPDEVRLIRVAQMRYVGQGHEIGVPLPDGPLGPGRVPEITAAFEKEYRELYARTCPDIAIETINWRLVATGPKPGIGFSRFEPGDASPEPAFKNKRKAYLPGIGDFVEVPVYERGRLTHGMVVAGPAIIEEPESTLVIGEASQVETDPYLNLVVTLH